MNPDLPHYSRRLKKSVQYKSLRTAGRNIELFGEIDKIV